MELAIDTSTRFASVGISREGELVSELTWRSERNHSVELMPTVGYMLKRSNITITDIQAIYVASGPGGFSALRVGMSAAKAMASSLSVPLIAVGTLDIEAHPYRGLGRPVCALIGAGRNRLYVGRFDDAQQPTYEVAQHSELASVAAGDAIFCGEAAADAADLIRSTFGNDTLIAAQQQPTRHANVLASLGWNMLRAGRTADPLTLEPIYLRSSQVDTANRTWRTGVPPSRI